MRRILAHGLLAVVLALTTYGLAAYLVLPRIWTRYDERSAGLLRPMVTVTLQGRPGDPINIGIVGDRAALDRAMAAAGWHLADPVTVVSSLRIAASVLFDRPYPQAPVSPLLYDGHVETVAFEKPDGRSADRRQHVRFWAQPTFGDGVSFLGSVTFDAGVGFSHYTGAVTHMIAPDVDAARNGLVADLDATGMVTAVRTVTGIGPEQDGRNGEGSPYRTDGDARILVLDGS
ncbi:LssY C-terminal domain-containing protein [Aureimonas phyllosphaerae]|uniref:LssY-like C-terminal domain-containing protein n=1 Tax=Aureimonas phyllosphaerae TaxID=1166078 RepID=A0A7W6BVV3_9HYPH|nr:LssY C-terminal domain-containing protein [Aureimonas phyllosphaerae]MBB3934691.1 hypothetical protein [Aureimonas phyllosphaerae]MBB3958093.1 hypothetical protein [Aureimonas phyllosphaerae]SFE91694.1 LssY C-terminus [Aureimonas phyllosphaerae]